MFDYINDLDESETEDKLLEYMLDTFVDPMRSIEISLLKDRIESFRRYRMENPA